MQGRWDFPMSLLPLFLPLQRPVPLSCSLLHCVSSASPGCLHGASSGWASVEQIEQLGRTSTPQVRKGVAPSLPGSCPTVPGIGQESVPPQGFDATQAKSVGLRAQLSDPVVSLMRTLPGAGPPNSWHKGARCDGPTSAAAARKTGDGRVGGQLPLACVEPDPPIFPQVVVLPRLRDGEVQLAVVPSDDAARAARLSDGAQNRGCLARCSSVA